jgi:hypothetical protein
MGLLFLPTRSDWHRTAEGISSTIEIEIAIEAAINVTEIEISVIREIKFNKRIGGLADQSRLPSSSHGLLDLLKRWRVGYRAGNSGGD